MEPNTIIENAYMEIYTLETRLASNLSDIGDWKVNKTYEYRLQGKPDPYDTEQLLADRQAARDRINELQALIEETQAQINAQVE